MRASDTQGKKYGDNIRLNNYVGMAWILWIFNKSDGDTFASCKAQKLWLSIHDAIRGQRADRRRG